MKLYTHTHTHTSNSIKNNRENKWINSQSDSVVCMKNATTGITLVALVITIVILLLLAGITIMYVMSDNGIFKKASDAKLKTDIASWQERLELAKEPVFINGLGIFDPDEYFEYIEEQEFIEDKDATSPEQHASYEMLKEQLEEVLDTLTDREENVLRLRFGLDDGRTRTLEEVGRVFGVTRERIRQIEAKALRKLRHPSRSNQLRDFLD